MSIHADNATASDFVSTFTGNLSTSTDGPKESGTRMRSLGRQSAFGEQFFYEFMFQ